MPLAKNARGTPLVRNISQEYLLSDNEKDKSIIDTARPPPQW